jgi:hypothetical protein
MTKKAQLMMTERQAIAEFTSSVETMRFLPQS